MHPVRRARAPIEQTGGAGDDAPEHTVRMIATASEAARTASRASGRYSEPPMAVASRSAPTSAVKSWSGVSEAPTDIRSG